MFHVMRASGSTVALRGDGGVDFKNIDLVTSVKKDQLLAVMKKEKPGLTDGHTVKGEVWKAQSGKPVSIDVGNNIRVEERGDAAEYYAGIDGQLMFDGYRLSVEPVLAIEGDVGPKTGHIKFNGIVHVKGSVQDTYNIFSKKDIIVEGNVGNCYIKTDGNLTAARPFHGPDQFFRHSVRIQNSLPLNGKVPFRERVAEFEALRFRNIERVVHDVELFESPADQPFHVPCHHNGGTGAHGASLNAGG